MRLAHLDFGKGEEEESRERDRERAGGRAKAWLFEEKKTKTKKIELDFFEPFKFFFFFFAFDDDQRSTLSALSLSLRKWESSSLFFSPPPSSNAHSLLPIHSASSLRRHPTMRAAGKEGGDERGGTPLTPRSMEEKYAHAVHNYEGSGIVRNS